MRGLGEHPPPGPYAVPTSRPSLHVIPPPLRFLGGPHAPCHELLKLRHGPKRSRSACGGPGSFRQASRVFRKCRNLTIYRPTAQHLQKVMGSIPNLPPQSTGNSLRRETKSVLMSAAAASGPQTRSLSMSRTPILARLDDSLPPPPPWVRALWAPKGMPLSNSFRGTRPLAQTWQGACARRELVNEAAPSCPPGKQCRQNGVCFAQRGPSPRR